VRPRSGRLALWLHIVLAVAILAGLVVAAVTHLRGAEMAAALRAFQWKYAAPILIFSALHLVLKAWWFGIAVNDVAPHVSVWRAMVAYLCGQPATLIPGGIAARAALLAELDVPASVGSVPILFSSLLDMVTFTLLTLVAALWFPDGRRPALITLGVMLAIAVAVAIPPLRRGLDWLLGGLMRRFRLGKQWENFTAALGRAASWKFLGFGLLITSISSFTIPVVLLFCVRAIGLSASLPALMLAVGLPTLIGRVTPSPAGAGPFDVGVVKLLGTAAGIGVNAAASALAVFRVATVLFHALLGVLVFALLWRPHRVRTADGPKVVAPEQLA
jgi:uncharacterized membrane protein YbhN (UPF0104 family)